MPYLDAGNQRITKMLGIIGLRDIRIMRGPPNHVALGKKIG
jgi:hypothetical protein